MSYQKPMVTIELREYQELQNLKELFHKTRVSDYETAIQVILQSMPAGTYTNFINRIKERLENRGLALIIQSFDNNDTIKVQVLKA